MPDDMRLNSPQHNTRILHGAALVAFLLPLLLYMFTGAYTRFIQDDYCYAVHLRTYGWPNAALQAYLFDAGFSGNRFALTFFLDLAELAGRFNVPALPAVMIVLWLPAVYVLIRQLNRVFTWKVDRLTAALLSTAVVCLTLYLAPNRVQILYWRPGMFTYLAPLVAFSWLAAWTASRLDRRFNAWTLAGIAAGAMLAGSFSETAAVFEGGVYSLGMLAAFLGLRRGGLLARSGFRLAWAGLLGSLLGMAGLILSPAARLRQAAMFPVPPAPLEIMRITLESARFFVVHTLYRVTLPTLAIGGLALCLGYLAAAQMEPGQRPALRRLLWRLLAAALAAIFLLVCVTAPSAYAEATYPEARVLLFARLVMVLFSGLAGWWGGEALAGVLIPTRHTQWFAWLVALPAVIYAWGMVLVQPGALARTGLPRPASGYPLPSRPGSGRAGRGRAAGRDPQPAVGCPPLDPPGRGIAGGYFPAPAHFRRTDSPARTTRLSTARADVGFARRADPTDAHPGPTGHHRQCPGFLGAHHRASAKPR